MATKVRRESLTLGTGKQLRYENELRGRLGLLPKGATLPAQVRLYGWLVTVLAGLLAAATRMIGLRHPHEIVFDETYYVKGAFSLKNYGYERNWEGDDANELFLQGDLSALEDTADRWVHPPFGKWIIGKGMNLFGDDNGFGWRFTTAFLGVLSVMLIVRIALRMFNSVILAGLAGVFMALDGMGITLSRVALLDGVLAFFILAGFWAVLKDRDHSRARLAHAIATGKLRPRSAAGNGNGPTTFLEPRDPWGPSLWWRPWLLAGGFLLGLACGVKWSGAFVLAVFGLLVYAWGTAARKAVNVRLWVGGGIFREGIPAFISFIPVALLGYLAAWIPWFANDKGWDRQWASEQQARNANLPAEEQVAMPIESAPDVVNSYIHYHQATMEFHTELNSGHTYESDAWAWLIQFRPVSFYWRGSDAAPQNCGSDDCVAAITSIGNPFVWWTAIIGLLIVLWVAIRRRDWRAWAIVAGYLGTWAPWFLYFDRTIYQFYAVTILPFVVLALVFGLAWATDMLKPPWRPMRELREIFGTTDVHNWDDGWAEGKVGGAESLGSDDGVSGVDASQEGVADEIDSDEQSHKLSNALIGDVVLGTRAEKPAVKSTGSTALRAVRLSSFERSLRDDDVIILEETTPTQRGTHEVSPIIANIPVPTKGAIIILSAVTGLVVLAALFWLPLWTGMSVPRWFWQLHMWLPTWV